MAADKFRDVDIIRDRDGVAAVITESIGDGRINVMIAREYENGGVTKRSAFLSRRHFPGVRRLLDLLEDRLDQLEDQTRAARR